MRINLYGLIFLFSCLISFCAYTQTDSAGLKQFLDNDRYLKKILLQYPVEVKEFYKNFHYKTVWLNHNYRVSELVQLLKQAPDLGLKIKDYQFDLIQSFQKNNLVAKTTDDSLATEVRFTDAAIHFFHDIVYGNASPPIGYNGLKYDPDCLDVLNPLALAIAGDQLLLLPAIIEQKTTEYLSLKNMIAWHNKIIADSNFKDVVIVSSKVSSANTALLMKLYQLGITDSVTQKLSDNEVKEKIKKAQQLLNLLSDGVLRKTSLEALNVPLWHRLEELKQALNTMRWLFCIKQSSHLIVINIPSASLLVYEQGKPILESRIIVGKKSTPTPTFSSKITEVILYPYWMVPYSIATKELLPSIKRNVDYINAGNYQVINLQGKVIDPYQINWQSLSRSYFPYIIRQSTGCDNSLGLIKLNFYTPYGVYLHDTPGKSFFSFNKRYFSHGCMRVQKAMELAHLVLKNNTVAIDTLEEKGCLRNQSPIVVSADETIPVFALYNTAWVDAAGKISFNDDIYNKKLAIKNKD